MNSPLISTLLDGIKNEFQMKEPIWTDTDLIEDDIVFLKDECEKPSQFDPHNRRKTLFDKFVNRTATICIKKCEYGKVFCILERKGQIDEIPWGLWGRILRLYYQKNKPFRVFLLADETLREFPERGPIKPNNINGGYTYACNRRSIVIYRAEDATRVLLHELMHSCCLDKMENGVDLVEAETEAWAELLYIGLLSEGKPIFKLLLQRQSEYMRKQNERIANMYNVTDENKDFPWRYTIGKQRVWERWGILVQENAKPYIKINSLRMTYPPDNNLKERFKVSRASIIL